MEKRMDNETDTELLYRGSNGMITNIMILDSLHNYGIGCLQ